MAQVAIVMRTKNRPILLKRAVSSVMSQTYADWQLILVNHGGETGHINTLFAEINGLQEKTLLVSHQSSSREAGYALGISHSESRYIAVHDDDDTWEPTFLEKTVAYLDSKKNSLVRGVVTQAIVVEEIIGGETITQVGEKPFFPPYTEVSLSNLAAYNIFPPIAFLYRRDALETVGTYREDIPVLADWDFHLRFALQYEIDVLPEVLARYHVRTRAASPSDTNTITSEAGAHAYYKNKLRNEALREDIREGKFGKGLLMMLAQGQHAVEVKTTQIMQHRNRIARALQKIWRGKK